MLGLTGILCLGEMKLDGGAGFGQVGLDSHRVVCVGWLEFRLVVFAWVELN